MKSKILNVIVVDDDSINNFITKRVIMEGSPNANVMTFTDPEQGLEYVLSIIREPSESKAILLLDINMPKMTGWQFMEHLKKEGPVVTEKLLIYILSSSIQPEDRERAKMDLRISDYIMKPITIKDIRSLME
jgi:CheY-like chemotaxis protein